MPEWQLWKCSVCGAEYSAPMAVKSVELGKHNKYKCRGTMKKVED